MDAGRQESQDDVTRFWREEREDGAVYLAYLKRVTYRSQARLEDEHDREFSHLMWETQKIRVIKAGTLEKLVESLATVRGELDSTYVNIFLATYRTFATPRQVLDLLIDRFCVLKSSSEDDKTEINELQLKTIKSVISVWLDQYPDDFREDPDYPCLHLLEKFAKCHLPDTDLAPRARHRIERFRKDHSGIAEQIEFRFSICDEVDHMIDTEYHKPLAFLVITNQIFAEQLTCRDADLFRKVVPHHCLGAVWARRGRKGGNEAPSVIATIQQFNRVSLRVIATVLKTVELKSSQRAKLLQKWIHIAQELRELKNFSSLRAIISGLQSHPVYRLRRTWAALPKETMVLFEGLSEIFSGENNQLNSRELLMKEATAKFPDLCDSQNKTLKRKNMQKRQSWIENGIVQGTVPYLGTFLTDLTMIDTANPDMTEDGLINFEKHRKEFEVLAQLKLLQSAAQIYNIKEDQAFWIWFDSVRVATDDESHAMSCSVEPPTEGAAKIKKKSASLGHRPAKFDSAKFAFFACGLEDRSSLSSIPDTFTASLAGPLMSHSSSTSSVISSDSDTSSSPYRSSDMCVIRVSLEPSATASTHIYKSIMLSNTDHTNTVLQKVLEKYSVEGRPEDFCLLQLLPDGELLIPERANVFYALNNFADLKFVVRSRAEHESLTLKRKGKRRFKKLSL